jgi:tetratricopeptide (TPR) repeat protein
MAKLSISFDYQNVRWGKASWIFRRRERMRFEWLALLAFRRLTRHGEAWVQIADIARLPSWAGKSTRHITTNLGRYLQAFEKNGLTLVTAETRWGGPYRLVAEPLAIEFDIPLLEVKQRLCLAVGHAALERQELYRFTSSYSRSQWLIFRGRLMHTANPKDRKRKDGQTAYRILLALARRTSLTPEFRLVARLAAVQLRFRIGQFGLARKMLLDNARTLRQVRDRGLKAQFYVALAWSDQRASSGAASDRAVESAIMTAGTYATTTGDRIALGLIAHRRGGYLTKRGLHLEAVNHLAQALEINLIAGNYDMVQASCGNIGSVLHRLGHHYYKEARQWLLLGIAIARWMKIGRDDAHGEMILAKIYIEQKKSQKASILLKRAERIAAQAANQVNLGDVKMVWGFWHKEFGKRSDERDTLVKALRIFRRISKFDSRQKERYMEQQFPEVWPAVLARL